jgi:hypothetical protein
LKKLDKKAISWLRIFAAMHLFLKKIYVPFDLRKDAFRNLIMKGFRLYAVLPEFSSVGSDKNNI